MLILYTEHNLEQVKRILLVFKQIQILVSRVETYLQILLKVQTHSLRLIPKCRFMNKHHSHLFLIMHHKLFHN
jgi:hypothetical protein